MPAPPTRQDDERILEAMRLHDSGLSFDEIAERLPERSRNGWIGAVGRGNRECAMHELDYAPPPPKPRGHISETEAHAIRMRKNGMTFVEIAKRRPEKTASAWCNFMRRLNEKNAA